MLLNQPNWGHSFQSLSSQLSDSARYQTLPDPKVVLFNQNHQLSEEWTATETLKVLEQLSSPHSLHPVAMAYAGHQFGQGVPQLGDGRGMLLGEWKLPSHENIDIYLKGSGTTKFSRGFDGRANLRSSIRELLVSVYCNAIGIPSTNALAVLTSSEQILRDEGYESAGLLIRTAKSHIRFGTFEWVYRHQNEALLTELAQYCIEHYYQDCQTIEEFLIQVIKKTAYMIATWQAYGFCHGVMNTDNMSIVGETFDFGPFSFLDDYDENFVCNLSDMEGRYRYNYQPSIGHWNIQILLSCFGNIMDKQKLREISNIFHVEFAASYRI